jgi:hypothetical protein
MSARDEPFSFTRAASQSGGANKTGLFINN